MADNDNGRGKGFNVVPIVVALIGLVGTVGAAIIANLDNFHIPTLPTPSLSTSADMSTLRSLLREKNWQGSDEETWKLIRKISSTRRLDVEDIRSFPCQDLATIDKLWTDSSHQKFGFSVQKRIWQSVSQNFNYDSWLIFADRVGWRINGSWVRYNNFPFMTDAPMGNLPTRAVGLLWNDWGLERDIALMHRLESCQI
jgi:hypothetical protein